MRRKKWLMRLKTTLLLSICILLIVMPHTVYAALTKTTSIDEIDAWQAVTEGTLVVGTADSISDSYATVLYIEVALTDSDAQGGCTVIVEVSYADDNWMRLIEFTGTAETPALTDLDEVGGAAAGETTITLTDATTGDYDVPGRKWFILDGTVGNSESVRTVVNSTHTVTLCQDLLRNHADAQVTTDRVDEWVVSIPFGVSYVRTLINNTDADAGVHFTTRISKVTAL